MRDRMKVSHKEHSAIVNAITQGDAERAAAALREHLLIQGERFSDLLSSLAQLQTQA